jgi:cytochrome b561
MSASPEQTYSATTRVLHWLIALLIIDLIFLGWYLADLSYFDKGYNLTLTIHKSVGMFALALAGAKILWAFLSPAPAFVDTIKPWDRVAAQTTHLVLYVMMVVIPVTGYAISTSAGSPVAFFDLFDIPAVLPKSEGLRDLAVELHYYLSYGTAILVAIHALGALKHQFIDQDGTLSRMLWSSSRPRI